MKDLARYRVIPVVASKWEFISDYLGIDHNVSENIDKKYRADPEACCREMFRLWLNGEGGSNSCTWENLLQALEQNKFCTVASDLRKKLT